jgi:hypothetical protein
MTTVFKTQKKYILNNKINTGMYPVFPTQDISDDVSYRFDCINRNINARSQYWVTPNGTKVYGSMTLNPDGYNWGFKRK